MKKLATAVLIALFTLPAFCAEQTFTNVPVIDILCAKKSAANPDAHTRDCALQCQGSGFAIVTSEQKVLKFDAEGNQKILSQIKSTKKQDHLRVDVSGDVQGDTLKVRSIKLL